MIYGSGGDLRDLRAVVERAITHLSQHADEFDSIAVRGMSGVLVGSPVALHLDKPLIIVRKPGEQRHSPDLVINKHNAGRRFLFLDDLISTGETRREVGRALRPAMEVATYLYQYDYYDYYDPGCEHGE
jgi:adenine/guanine phosphoribosyltransferase-like PRPP-binding protein